MHLLESVVLPETGGDLPGGVLPHADLLAEELVGLGMKPYLLYPPDPRTEKATMREAMLCQREGITINIILLPSWSQTEEDVSFAQRMAQTTGGRVMFAGGEDLDRFVVWDYVNRRRSILG